MTTRTTKGPISRRSTRRSRIIRPAKAEAKEALFWLMTVALLTQVSPGQADEYGLEVGLVHADIAYPVAVRRPQNLGQQTVDALREKAQAAAGFFQPLDLRERIQTVDERLFAVVLAQGELDESVRAEIRFEVRGRVERQNLAVVHDRDAIAKLVGFLHVMRGQHHGDS